MCVCVSASVSTKNEENLSPKFKMIFPKKRRQPYSKNEDDPFKKNEDDLTQEVKRSPVLTQTSTVHSCA